jgi:predicted DNA-binding transcriptional regulator YafY
MAHTTPTQFEPKLNLSQLNASYLIPNGCIDALRHFGDSLELRCFMTTERDSEIWNKSNRLHKLEQLLSLKFWSTKDLADAMGVNQRTAQRYLTEFEARVGPLDKQGKTYRFERKRLQLTDVGALAAHAAVRLLFHHTPGYDREYLSTLDFLAQHLPEPARALAERSTQQLEARRSTQRLDQQEGMNLAKVAQAWFEGRILNFEYVSPGGSGETRQKSLLVYFVEISRNNLGMYVIGYERSWHNKILTFKVSRLRHATVTNERYTIPEDFDPSKYLSDAWGVIGNSDGESIEIKLRFAKEVKYRILEGGYPNLEIVKEHPDGQLDVKIRAGVDKTGLPREVLPWILGFGPRVEILAPKHVQEHWLAEMRTAIERFGGK